MVGVSDGPVQGDVFWVDLGEPIGSGPGFRHPCVVIQSNALNRSKLPTLLICMLTSNLNRARARGNVLLERREAGLAKPSVAVVSQLYTIDRTQLAGRIGTLSTRRVLEIAAGVHLVIDLIE